MAEKILENPSIEDAAVALIDEVIEGQEEEIDWAGPPKEPIVSTSSAAGAKKNLDEIDWAGPPEDDEDENLDEPDQSIRGLFRAVPCIITEETMEKETDLHCLDSICVKGIVSKFEHINLSAGGSGSDSATVSASEDGKQSGDDEFPVVPFVKSVRPFASVSQDEEEEKLASESLETDLAASAIAADAQQSSDLQTLQAICVQGLVDKYEHLDIVSSSGTGEKSSPINEEEIRNVHAAELIEKFNSMASMDLDQQINLKQSNVQRLTALFESHIASSEVGSSSNLKPQTAKVIRVRPKTAAPVAAPEEPIQPAASGYDDEEFGDDDFYAEDAYLDDDDFKQQNFDLENPGRDWAAADDDEEGDEGDDGGDDGGEGDEEEEGNDGEPEY